MKRLFLVAALLTAGCTCGQEQEEIEDLQARISQLENQLHTQRDAVESAKSQVTDARDQLGLMSPCGIDREIESTEIESLLDDAETSLDEVEE